MWAGTFLGMAWGKWIALVAIAATLGALNGWIMLTARVSLADFPDRTFFVVAKRGRRELYFDEVEEEFGIASLNAQGQLTDLGTYGDRLAWSLVRL